MIVVLCNPFGPDERHRFEDELDAKIGDPMRFCQVPSLQAMFDEELHGGPAVTVRREFRVAGRDRAENGELVLFCDPVLE